MTDDRTPGAAAPPPARSPASLMNFARGAKGIALLGFLLPWVTVSCAGTPLIRMSGLDMATGNVNPVANPAAGFPGAGNPPALSNLSQNADSDIFVIVAAVLIVAGLVLSFVLPRRTGALVGMATAAGAIAVAAYDVFIRIKSAVSESVRESAARSGGPGGGGANSDRELQQFAPLISVQPSIGFWITILALIAAIVLFKMVHGRPGDPYRT